jgi:8-oxo-dGTP pyrophosphatase MutT (NUDIX family)
MSALRLAVLHGLYRVAWRALQLRSLLWPRRGRGVKCVITQRERVLLVRHTYGRRRTWYLPGGIMRRGETPPRAAAREMAEELGLRDLRWRELGARDMRLDGLTVRLACLHAELADPTVAPDPVEIAEARWFDLKQLPVPRGSEVGSLLLLFLHATGRLDPPDRDRPADEPTQPGSPTDEPTEPGSPTDEPIEPGSP